MKSDEKALFEMKSDKKALLEMKGWIVRDKEVVKKTPGFAAKPKRGAPMQFENLQNMQFKIFRNLRSRKRKKNLLSEL